VRDNAKEIMAQLFRFREQGMSEEVFQLKVEILRLEETVYAMHKERYENPNPPSIVLKMCPKCQGDNQ